MCSVEIEEQEYMINLVTKEVITVDEYDMMIINDLKAWYEVMDTAEYPSFDIFFEEMTKTPLQDEWVLCTKEGNIL